MKGSVILIFAIFLTPLVFAISTDMKEIYQPGETMILEISGNILQPISNQDIILKKTNSPGIPSTPFIYNVKKIAGKYYLWGTVPTDKENYTLHIKNIATTQSGSVTFQDFNQSFSVSGELISYSITPGFNTVILGEDLDFNINLNNDSSETINSDFPSEQTITLTPGQNSVILPTRGSPPGFRRIQLGIYSIPIQIFQPTINPPLINKPSIRIIPHKIDSIILFGETQVYPFTIINDGKSEVTDLVLNYDLELFEIKPSTIGTILPNETKEFNITLKNQDPVFENIILTSSSFSRSLLINITYTQNQSEVGTPYLEENSTGQGFYCAELGGVFCSADETCSAETIEALDGSCCTGSCNLESDSSSFVWIGWSLSVLILIILIWVFMKYKKQKKSKVNPMQKRIAQGHGNPLVSPPVRPKKP
jgi:hypothetical protein